MIKLFTNIFWTAIVYPHMAVLSDTVEEVGTLSIMYSIDVHVHLISLFHIGQSTASLLRVNGGTNLTRLNSHYMRELSNGHFLIKYEHITQLENIGQGITF